MNNLGSSSEGISAKLDFGNSSPVWSSPTRCSLGPTGTRPHAQDRRCFPHVQRQPNSGSIRQRWFWQSGALLQRHAAAGNQRNLHREYVSAVGYCYHDPGQAHPAFRRLNCSIIKPTIPLGEMCNRGILPSREFTLSRTRQTPLTGPHTGLPLGRRKPVECDEPARVRNADGSENSCGHGGRFVRRKARTNTKTMARKP